ncbi:acid protease [Cubamyces sp. BRFM 1775]|nr:acid protease [Cubamyces sp. BRFM 1775]
MEVPGRTMAFALHLNSSFRACRYDAQAFIAGSGARRCVVPSPIPPATRFMLLSPLLSALFLSTGLVSAGAAIPKARADTPVATPSSPYPVAVSHSGDSGGFGFTNSQGTQYTATIHVNGVPFQVIVDTGSSDTWVDPLSAGVSLPPNLIPTGYNSTTPYGDNTVSTGPIVLANVTFGPYTVCNQAITLSFNSSADAGKPVNGLIGLGGYLQDGSTIYTSLANTSYAENGVSIIFNIFEHLPDLPNYMTFLMSRSSGGFTDGGLLTVSEVLSNLTDILQAPLLNSLSDEFWETTLDGLYLMGKPVLGGSQQENSGEASGPTWNRSAILDTGTTRITAPLSDVHEFYKHIPGASPMKIGDTTVMYRVPCDTKLNVTLSLRRRSKLPPTSHRYGLNWVQRHTRRIHLCRQHLLRERYTSLDSRG